MNIHIDVALILWNPDVIELVSMVLLNRDLKSFGVEPSADPVAVEHLIAAAEPSVVVFDLEPPYERSAILAMRLRDRFPNRSFVITCADAKSAVKKAPWLSGHAVFQKPYEIDALANTVRSMVRPSHKTLVASTSAC
jgi:hypothetical protein